MTPSDSDCKTHSHSKDGKTSNDESVIYDVESKTWKLPKCYYTPVSLEYHHNNIK